MFHYNPRLLNEGLSKVQMQLSGQFRTNDLHTEQSILMTVDKISAYTCIWKDEFLLKEWSVVKSYLNNTNVKLSIKKAHTYFL